MLNGILTPAPIETLATKRGRGSFLMALHQIVGVSVQNLITGQAAEVYLNGHGGIAADLAAGQVYRIAFDFQSTISAKPCTMRLGYSLMVHQPEEGDPQLGQPFDYFSWLLGDQMPEAEVAQAAA